MIFLILLDYCILNIMKFIITRESLLKPLQQVNNPINARPNIPILGNLLMRVSNGLLLLTATDLEVEMQVHIMLTQPYESGTTTVKARKLLDICRGLPLGSEINITLNDNYILLRSGYSRFLLSTLPASQYPNLDTWESKIEFMLSQITLKRLIEATQFSMAHQDVRYYLNGIMFEMENKELRTVATDGHRLAVCSMTLDDVIQKHSIIIPRKGVIELLRLLDGSNKLIQIQIGNTNIRTSSNEFTFTSKLIDGNFPDYRNVLSNNTNKSIEINCNLLKNAFMRAAIISNEKISIIRLFLSQNKLKVIANNNENEESEELLDVSYNGNTFEIILNANYILDVLNAIKCVNVRLRFTDSVSSIKIENIDNNDTIYIIMPMRI